MAENPFKNGPASRAKTPDAITTDEYKFILAVIAEANFPGKEVLIVADIVNKIKSHVEFIERGGSPPSRSPGQLHRKG